MRSSRTVTLASALALLVLAIASDRLRDGAHARYMSAQRYEDIYYLPPADWLRVFSLGYDEALADLIWMRALVYFGQEFEHAGHVQYVFEYAEAIEALDPHFLAIYRWIGMAGLYRPDAITPEDIERSVAFMQRGARIYPEDGQLAWNIGAALVFELPPLLDDDDAIARAHERGTPYLMTAVRQGNAPSWAAFSNLDMLARVGRQEQAARHLEEMYEAEEDPRLREQIAIRIRSLRDRVEADAFLGAMRELDRERQRDYPYLAPSMYLHVGRPVDVVAPIRLGIPRAIVNAEDETGGPHPAASSDE